MKWLITGGCGFLGTSLIENLVKEDGHSVRVIDNLTVGTREDLAGVTEYVDVNAGKLQPMRSGAGFSCELIEGDILDIDLALDVCKGADVIVHFAANTGVPVSVEHPREDCMANVLGTFNYLESARQNGVKRFVFASSGAPAGEVEPPIHEELPAHPVSPYGASKLAGEGYCSAYYHSYGIETVALRFGNVYGPGSLHKSSVVAKFIKHALDGEPLEIYGDGAQTRDFIYIDDLIEAVRLSATVESIGGEVFQIATNRETTVGEMTELLLDVLVEAGVKDIKVINGETRLGDVKRNFSDTTKARVRMEWVPKTELLEGLKLTVSYFTV